MLSHMIGTSSQWYSVNCVGRRCSLTALPSLTSLTMGTSPSELATSILEENNSLFNEVRTVSTICIGTSKTRFLCFCVIFKGNLLKKPNGKPMLLKKRYLYIGKLPLLATQPFRAKPVKWKPKKQRIFKQNHQGEMYVYIYIAIKKML